MEIIIAILEGMLEAIVNIAVFAIPGILGLYIYCKRTGESFKQMLLDDDEE